MTTRRKFGLRMRAALAICSTAAVLATTTPAGSVAGFGDVPAAKFYTDAVQWMVDNDITTGTSPTCYSPDEPVTRGQVAAFLWRMEGSQLGSPPHQFNDVVKDWQQVPISWMAELGVTEGTSTTTYSPAKSLTRGELAALLHRLAGEPVAPPPNQFPDVVRPWQIGPVGWMLVNDITTGTTTTTFSPESPVTRGQVATFLYRYKLKRPVVVDTSSPFCFNSPLTLGLETTLTGLSSPTAAGLDETTGDIYITERTGRLKRVPAGTGGVPDFGSISTVIDLSAKVRSGGERGLLGVTVAPDGSKIYVGYTAAGSGASVIAEYGLAAGVIDSGSERIIITVAQPSSNHNGGNLIFGPDGFLYTSFGDGGGSNDQHGSIGNGQDTSTLLGSILRIDVSGTSPGKQYAIPAGNPFVGKAGADEIFIYGVRNPWKFSFDALTGDLWVADVGQGAREEVTLLSAARGGGNGANLGWRLREGSIATPGSAGGPIPAGHVGPIHEYDHNGGGCSITGGFVYRGDAIPALRGVYLFSDFCRSQIWGIRHGANVEAAFLGVNASGGSPSSFAEDINGEIYTLSLGGTMARFVQVP